MAHYILIHYLQLFHDKFTAELKKEDYGSALIFDIEKLEKFEDLYSDSRFEW